MTKQKQLEQVAKEIAICKDCQLGKSGEPVPGEGNPNAKIMLIGEAPGRQESLTGRPFVGRSGKFLTRLLESISIKRENVYITSPVKYYPGARAPLDAEISHGRVHLQKQIDIISPKLVVLLGKVAAKSVLGTSLMIGKFHGRAVKRDGREYFFTFHPSAALRFPKIRILMTRDFRKLSRRL